MKDIKLFGEGRTERIVAVSVDFGKGEDTKATLWRRLQDGTLVTEARDFYPYIFTHGAKYANRIRRSVARDGVWDQPLGGDHFYNHIIAFETIDDYFGAYSALKHYGEGSGLPDDVYVIGDLNQQYLIQSGETLFAGMEFKDIHRMQLDIETYAPNGFPNPKKRGNPVIMISLTDNDGFEYLLSLDEYDGDEEAMLRDLMVVIQDVDPDVIEGHNIFDFDLRYLETRSEIHDVAFEIGRGGGVPRSYESKKRAAERYIDYRAFDIRGRHVMDTMFAAYDWDVYARALPAYNLKDVAKFFGVAPEGRTYVPGEEISDYWEDPEKRETLKAYAMDDVYETRAIAEHLCGSNFYTTQMLPLPYDKVARLGTGSKIESLFVREYLRNRQSLPKPQPKEQFEGGYTEIFLRGVYQPAVNADVSSLYPSIMLNFDCIPESDTLGIFKDLLNGLFDLRFEWKDAMKDAAKRGDDREESKYDGMQAAAKILINSFYGYLSYAYGLFNDYEQGSRVTRIGRRILKIMIAWLEENEGTVIEADTDGVWFVPPEEIREDKDGIRAYIEEMSDTLPQGIDLDMDAYLKAFISYKKKNYAKVKEDGSLAFKGGAMMSRQYEEFGIEYVQEGFRLLGEYDVQGLHDLYVETTNAIIERDLPVEKMAKTETLKETPEEYEEAVELGHGNGGHHKYARYELAKKRAEETGRWWSTGESVSYYIAGDKPKSRVRSYKDARLVDNYEGDANLAYYVGKRMRAFNKKFKPFFTGEDFERIFPKRNKAIPIEREDVSDIRPLNRRIREPDFDRKKLLGEIDR